MQRKRAESAAQEHEEIALEMRRLEKEKEWKKEEEQKEKMERIDSDPVSISIESIPTWSL